MKALYYFRNDLRLSDNALLKEACNSSSEILFMAKAPQKSWGVWRQKFHWESLNDLNSSLQKYGHKLLILESPLQEIDLQNFDILYTPRITAVYEWQEIKNVTLETRSFWTDRLLPSLPYETKQLPDVFTSFRKEIEKDFKPFPLQGLPSIWPKPLEITVSGLTSPEFPQTHPQSAFPYCGGETAALHRLDEYTFKTNLIKTYKKTRNGLVGTSYSTKLSPYLALGSLSANQVFHQVDLYEEQVHKNQDTYWVKFELWWREYFRWVYEKYGNHFFLKYGLKRKELPSNPDDELFIKWKEGNTGDDFVDANMRELKSTGFMSNRGRQNVASYLVKDLQLPWKWGARYFESELIDYDVFSNWGNWLYVAGVGNDPRPNRYFNTQKQASMYDEDGSFRKLWSSS